MLKIAPKVNKADTGGGRRAARNTPRADYSTRSPDHDPPSCSGFSACETPVAHPNRPSTSHAHLLICSAHWPDLAVSLSNPQLIAGRVGYCWSAATCARARRALESCSGPRPKGLGPRTRGRRGARTRFRRPGHSGLCWPRSSVAVERDPRPVGCFSVGLARTQRPLRKPRPVFWVGFLRFSLFLFVLVFQIGKNKPLIGFGNVYCRGQGAEQRLVKLFADEAPFIALMSSFETFDALFVDALDLRGVAGAGAGVGVGAGLMDVSALQLLEQTTLHTLQTNTRIPTMFTLPSHFKGFTGPAGAMRHHSETDFRYASKMPAPGPGVRPSMADMEFPQDAGSALATLAPSLSGTVAAPAPPPGLAAAAAASASAQLSHSDILLLRPEPALDPPLKLLDEHQVLCSAGPALCAKLDGKFYLNARFLSKLGADDVPVACYRRNYINVDVDVDWKSCVPRYVVTGDGQKFYIEQILCQLSADSNFGDSSPEICFFDPPKVASGAVVSNNRIENYSHEIALDSTSTLPSLFSFRRFQFKKATPNNGKFIVRDYYYLKVALVALVTSDDPPRLGAKRARSIPITLASVRSNPLSVRGRNPSFYNNRDDVLIEKKELGQ